MSKLFTVDIDKTFRDKNPKLYKMLPKFILKYLKKIVHQDDVNEILHSYGNEYKGLEFNRKVVEHLHITYEIENPENFPPKDNRYIFASNHPLGGLDGIVLIDIIGENYGSVKFVVNDLLMYLTPLEDVFAPVNKHGRQSADYAATIDELYSSNKQVLYFPAGLCSRKIKGKIADPEWKKSFVVKAIQYKRDIVPIFFEAHNSNFFYNLANIRKFFKIKANVEMLYLSDELFKKKGAKFNIKIGKPIPYQQLKEMGVKQSIAYVRNKVYEMEPKKIK